MGEMAVEGARVQKPSVGGRRDGGLDLLWIPLGDFLSQILKSWVKMGNRPGPSGSCSAGNGCLLPSGEGRGPRAWAGLSGEGPED